MSETAFYFSHPMVVPFQDIDAAGIVFFARIFDYFHDAFVACMSARGLSLPDVIARGDWGAPLAHAEADYSRPLRFGDRVRAEIVRAEFGETSMTLHHQLVSDDAARLILATGRTVHVFIDRTSFRPRPVPDAARAAFTAEVEPALE
jgi:1,4-dihydroxy-2-naphthoyl-CoA hydrolase